MMRRTSAGATLVELLIAMVVMVFITGAAAAMLNAALQSQDYADSQTQLLSEGVIVMERMTLAVRLSTVVLAPAVATSGTTLTLSGTVNDDDDYYFPDEEGTLFPRIDEDPVGDANADGKAGISGMDDNDDGVVDTTGAGIADDDEDGFAEEDGTDAHSFSWDGSTTLQEIPAVGTTVTLSTQVSNFQVSYEDDDGVHDARLLITLTVTGADGNSLTLSEYAYPRNITQRYGKRVR